MPLCESCGDALSRTHRRFVEKLMYSAVYRCKKCATRKGQRRSYALFAAHCCCPKCGNPEPQRRSKVDRIDKVAMVPLSLIQRVLGGHLYHCVYCRIQFYDLRSVKEPEIGQAGSPG